MALPAANNGNPIGAHIPGSRFTQNVVPRPTQQNPNAPGVTYLSNGGNTNPSDVTYQQLDPNALVGNQLNGLLSSDSPYIQLARAQGTQQAASRGLLNSSMAAGTAENAAIAAGLPIAQGNASEIAGVHAANQQAANQFTGENIAANAQTTSAGIQAAAQQATALINAGVAYSGQKQQFQEYGMGLGYQYASLGQQGQQFQQQLQQQGSEFSQNLAQNMAQFQTSTNLNVGEFQQGMAWNQYALGTQLNSQAQNNYGSAFVSIMNNPNMTADQRSSALANAHDFFQQQSQYNAAIPAFVPAWSIDPDYWATAWTSGH